MKKSLTVALAFVLAVGMAPSSKPAYAKSARIREEIQNLIQDKLDEKADEDKKDDAQVKDAADDATENDSENDSADTADTADVKNQKEPEVSNQGAPSNGTFDANPITVEGGEEGTDYEWTAGTEPDPNSPDENKQHGTPGTLTIHSGADLTLKGGTEDAPVEALVKVTSFAAGKSLTLNGLHLLGSIQYIANTTNHYGLTINLADNSKNEVNNTHDWIQTEGAGIQKNNPYRDSEAAYASYDFSKDPLTIQGNGELVAIGYEMAAGIGSGYYCLSVTSDGDAAGQAGYGTSYITIKGNPTIIACAGDQRKINNLYQSEGAGIGSGAFDSRNTVTHNYVGNGCKAGSAKNITIEGGNIKAISGYTEDNSVSDANKDWHANWGAGIGGARNGGCENIFIKGGNIEAACSNQGSWINPNDPDDYEGHESGGAGIGGGEIVDAGIMGIEVKNIQITGGTVNAYCAKSGIGGAAGIGGGYNLNKIADGAVSGGNLDGVLISGANTTVEASSDLDPTDGQAGGAGIGGGAGVFEEGGVPGGNAKNITIKDGAKVIAVSGQTLSGGAGIGGGWGYSTGGNAENITIEDSAVYASSGVHEIGLGAGIGGGGCGYPPSGNTDHATSQGGTCKNVTIKNSGVTAISSTAFSLQGFLPTIGLGCGIGGGGDLNANNQSTPPLLSNGVGLSEGIDIQNSYVYALGCVGNLGQGDMDITPAIGNLGDNPGYTLSNSAVYKNKVGSVYGNATIKASMLLEVSDPSHFLGEGSLTVPEGSALTFVADDGNNKIGMNGASEIVNSGTINGIDSINNENDTSYIYTMCTFNANTPNANPANTPSKVLYADCNSVYKYTAQQLSDQSATGHTFKGWYAVVDEDDSGNPVYGSKLTSNDDVLLNVHRIDGVWDNDVSYLLGKRTNDSLGDYTVKVNDSEASTAAKDDTVNVSVNTKDGFKLSGVYYKSLTSGTITAATANDDGTYSFTMPDDSVEIIPYWENDGAFELTPSNPILSWGQIEADSSNFTPANMSQTVTLTNTGKQDVTLGKSLLENSNFTVSGYDLDQEKTLAPGESVTVTITYDPSNFDGSSFDTSLGFSSAEAEGIVSEMYGDFEAPLTTPDISAGSVSLAVVGADSVASIDMGSAQNGSVVPSSGAADNYYAFAYSTVIDPETGDVNKVYPSKEFTINPASGYTLDTLVFSYTDNEGTVHTFDVSDKVSGNKYTFNPADIDGLVDFLEEYGVNDANFKFTPTFVKGVTPTPTPTPSPDVPGGDSDGGQIVVPGGNGNGVVIPGTGDNTFLGIFLEWLGL